MATNNIQQAFELFESIGSTSSRTAKEDYLKKGKDNKALLELLVLTYNPFIVFNIKKAPKVTPEGMAVTDFKYMAFTSLLTKLQSREVTGNAAIAKVEEFFGNCTEQEFKWYLKVLQKDLKIGITDATINKVFKGLVPTFSCMLAHPLKKFPKRSIADRKLDGYRCLAFNYGDGRVELRTRNGKLIEGYEGIEADVALLPKGYVYDGEIMGRGGKFNETQKAAFKKVKGKDGVLHIFDMVTIPDFQEGKSGHPLHQRLEWLDSEEVSLQIAHANSLTRVSPSEVLEGEAGEQRAYELHAQFVAEGYEGTMIKDLDSYYECKRSYAVQKIKDMDTLDLTVVDVLEGEQGTKYQGKLGALVVEFGDNTVNVGSGYTDAMRDEFWTNRNDLINRTIEVKYQEITTNKEGKQSLRFPVFVQFRHDK